MGIHLQEKLNSIHATAGPTFLLIANGNQQVTNKVILLPLRVTQFFVLLECEE